MDVSTGHDDRRPGSPSAERDGPLAEEADRRSGSTQEPSAGISRPATADVRVAATVRCGDPSGPCSPCISRAGHNGAADRRALPSSAPPSSAGSATADGYQAFARPSQGPRLGPTSGSGPVWRAAHLRRRPRHVRHGPTLHSCSFHLAWGEQVPLVRADQLFAQLIRQRRQVRHGHVPTVMHGRIEKTSCRRPARGYSSAEAPPSTVALAAGSTGVLRRFPNRTAIDASDPSDPSGHRKLRSSRGARRHPTHRIAMRSFAVRPASPPRCRKACHQS